MLYKASWVTTTLKRQLRRWHPSGQSRSQVYIPPLVLFWASCTWSYFKSATLLNSQRECIRLMPVFSDIMSTKAFCMFSYFYVISFFIYSLLYCFPLLFIPLIPPPPSNHHTVVRVHESFPLFAQSLHPLFLYFIVISTVRDLCFLLTVHLLLQTLLLESEERQATTNKQLGLSLTIFHCEPRSP